MLLRYNLPLGGNVKKVGKGKTQDGFHKKDDRNLT